MEIGRTVGAMADRKDHHLRGGGIVVLSWCLATSISVDWCMLAYRDEVAVAGAASVFGRVIT